MPFIEMCRRSTGPIRKNKQRSSYLAGGNTFEERPEGTMPPPRRSLFARLFNVSLSVDQFSRLCSSGPLSCNDGVRPSNPLDNEWIESTSGDDG